MVKTKFIAGCVVIVILLEITGCNQNREPVTNKISQETQIDLKQVNTNINTQLEILNSEVKNINNQLDFEFSMVSSCCRNCYDSDDINREIRKEYDIQIEPLLIKIDHIEQELTHLKEISNGSKSNPLLDPINLMSLITAIVTALAGFVIVLGGLSIFRSWIDNRRKLKEELETKFNPWLKAKENECNEQINKMLQKYESFMIQYGYYMRLTWLINRPLRPGEKGPGEKEIYFLLTNLTSQPRLAYKALFQRIKEMNISDVINKIIEDALKKLNEQITAKRRFQ